MSPQRMQRDVADDCQHGPQDPLVAPHSAGRPAVAALLQPVSYGLPDCVAGGGLDSCVQIGVQLLELVLDLCLGLAGDLPPQALAAGVEAEAHRAVPAALAFVPVDRVLAVGPALPRLRHAERLPRLAPR